MNRIQVIAKNTEGEQYSSSAAAPAACEKAVHRASHFPVGAKNILGLRGGVGNFFFSNLGGVELFFTILGNSREFLGIPKGIPRIPKGFPRNSHLGFPKFQQTINQTLFMNYCVFLMYNFFH